ncbi:MAG: hypothetical protein KDK06_07540 [Gammaproteobacteria bacterium]|nr:hypothetical protein [Gammaproteobacteria bacterium]
MPHYEFREGAETDDWVDQGSRLLNLVVRVIGLVLLGTGFIVALLVISSAWSLYENPARIEAFALEVERGSNLDLTLSSAVSRGRSQVEDATAVDAEAIATAPGPAAPAFRFSYFVAWMLAILLLLLIGRLAIAAVRTGGELALYDVKVGKLARALLRERQRAGG